MFILVPLKHTIHFFRSLFIVYWRGIPLKLYIRAAAWRTGLTGFTPRQIQAIAPTFPETYRKWMADKLNKGKHEKDQLTLSRLRPDIECMTTGSLYWIGDRAAANKIVLFFHGGGYIAPIIAGHLNWCYRAYVLAAAAIDIDCAVAVLQYTLVPEARYPVQLQQAVSALKHIIQAGTDPSDIIIGGDSAGGNLAVQVLGHLLHPHPSVEPLKIQEPLAGTFTVSPWLSACGNAHSCEENKHVDMLSPEFVRAISHGCFKGYEFDSQVAENRGWGMPLDVPGSWFNGLGAVTRRLYVTAGEQEILRDDAIRFAESVRTNNADVKVELEVSESEAHDFIAVEAELGIDGDAMQRMIAWFQSTASTKDRQA
ncbi:alpha/beta-hydrolase [Thozetella sp. PMI_491]|nr:alpha/beta-hydrolase [Thozetella sp. PMI_491]